MAEMRERVSYVYGISLQYIKSETEFSLTFYTIRKNIAVSRSHLFGDALQPAHHTEHGTHRDHTY